MGGVQLDVSSRLTVSEFHAFLDDRPESERWELIDGVPMMMAPPTLVHQRIARNLETLLNDHLAKVRPQWEADREIGVLLPADERYNPEPGVTVIDAEIAMGQLYAERFHIVAEVLSDPRARTRNPRTTIEEKGRLRQKLEYYEAHEHCGSILFVRQDRVRTTLHVRSRGFRPQLLVAPTDRLVLDVIGDIGSLGQLYRATPLAPPAATA